jgi:NAD(P)-dependent dehydrogenase (short-subunit alcohol dehydrogenase family)
LTQAAKSTPIDRRGGSGDLIRQGHADEGLLRGGNQGIPLGRWGRPQDTANLVEWVVGDAGAWMTGQTLVSDGGSSLGWT